MNSNTILNSFHNYLTFVNQPIFNHTILEGIDFIKDINLFFDILDSYFKCKLIVIDSSNIFIWEATRDMTYSEVGFNFEEFIEFAHRIRGLIKKIHNNSCLF